MRIYNYSFLISVVSSYACNRSLISLEAFVYKITLIGLILTKYQIKRRAVSIDNKGCKTTMEPRINYIR